MSGPPAALVLALSPANRADLKSVIVTVPLWSITMFCGRRSWCSISIRWKACRPLAICATMARTDFRSGLGWSIMRCASVWPSMGASTTQRAWRWRMAAKALSTSALSARRSTDSYRMDRARSAASPCGSIDGALMTTCCPASASASVASQPWLRLLARSSGWMWWPSMTSPACRMGGNGRQARRWRGAVPSWLSTSSSCTICSVRLSALPLR